jgi:sortase A
MSNKVTEKQLEQLFAGEKPRSLGNPWKWVIIFAGMFVAVLVIINLPAFSSNFDYWFKTEFNNDSYEDPVIDKVVNNQKNPSELAKTVNKNTIYLDKINVKAPIIFNVPNDADSVAANLQNGVIHIAGAAHPGEIGNVFLTGHSSNFVWARGNYNNIFSRLNNLQVNDNIVINYNDVIYIYRVSDKYVASASAIGNLKQNNNSEITLMTCYPIGTNINRLIIKGVQVKPDPSANQKKAPSTLDSLPDIRR